MGNLPTKKQPTTKQLPTKQLPTKKQPTTKQLPTKKQQTTKLLPTKKQQTTKKQMTRLPGLPCCLRRWLWLRSLPLLSLCSCKQEEEDDRRYKIIAYDSYIKLSLSYSCNHFGTLYQYDHSYICIQNNNCVLYKHLRDETPIAHVNLGVALYK